MQKEQFVNQQYYIHNHNFLKILINEMRMQRLLDSAQNTKTYNDDTRLYIHNDFFTISNQNLLYLFYIHGILRAQCDVIFRCSM
jgi:hypothetical protein